LHQLSRRWAYRGGIGLIELVLHRLASVGLIELALHQLNQRWAYRAGVVSIEPELG